MLQCWNTKRTRAIYQAKGYSADWIEKRMRSIAIRDEWKKRGVKEQREYAILTAEISKATFGLTPTEYAEFKRLKRKNFRDCSGRHPACHRAGLPARWNRRTNFPESSAISCAVELPTIFPGGKMRALYGRQDAHRYISNARRELEKKSGRKVVTNENYLALTQGTKKAKRIK